MKWTLEKIDKYTWFTKDKQYAVLKGFGTRKFWIGKLTIQPDEKTLWRVERCVDNNFLSWREARAYLIYKIYKNKEV